MGDRSLELRAREFDLLAALARDPGVVLTRDALLENVWGTDFPGETRTVDVHVAEVRKKLGDDGPQIETVRGVGYRLVPPPREHGRARMIPRNFTRRIILAFVALGVALLIAVSVSLYVVLRELQQDKITSSLGNQVVLIEAAFIHQPATIAQSQLEQAIKDYSGPIVADGGFIIVHGPKGAIRFVVGDPPGTGVPEIPHRADRFRAHSSRHHQTFEGNQYIYIEPNTSGTRNFTFFFAVPDRSAQRALGRPDANAADHADRCCSSSARRSRGCFRARSPAPMKRLAQAARDLPGKSGDVAPLPVEGPTEVRALTERFNEMARELASTRHEESQMLANLRHDLRTPLTSIGGFAEAIADGTASGDKAVDSRPNDRRGGAAPGEARGRTRCCRAAARGIGRPATRGARRLGAHP